MPFVVPQPQQPERQKSTGEGYSRDRDGYSAGRGGDMNRQQPQSYRQPQPQYQQPQRQGNPWQQQRQQLYRQQAQYRQPAQQPQYQPQRDPYGQRGGGRGYQQPMPRGYDNYGRQPQRQQYVEPQAYSNRPQQGTYVGEGVYADGTPMPPVSSSGYNGQSLIQSNAGPAGGVYSNFDQTPDVIGGITPRAYYEEDETYNKPMRVGRGQGGIY